MSQFRENYDLAKGFVIEGGKIGILLLHGFIGNASEMEEMADYLAEKGITASAPTLPGRGILPREMIKTTRQEWLDAANASLNELKGKCERVFVCGQSMGGAIALHLAVTNEVAGVITLSTPVWINPMFKWARFFKYFVKYANRVEVDIEDPAGKKKYRGYRKIPLASVVHLDDLVKQVRQELPQVKVPVLIIHSNSDQTVVATNSKIIYDRLGTQQKKVVILEKSGHLLTLDYERQEVFRETYNFITSVEAGNFHGEEFAGIVQ